MKDAAHWANLIQNDLSDNRSLAEESRFLISMVEKIQADARTLELEDIVHGTNCQKVVHDGRGGYLHAFDDDSPYIVDGQHYCGRCHVCL